MVMNLSCLISIIHAWGKLLQGKLSYPYCCEDSLYHVVALGLQVIYSVITQGKLSWSKLS